MIAGQFNLTAEVTYPGEPTYEVTFVGSTYGTPGPVVMVTEDLNETFVTDPGRFGSTFNPSWVRAFFA